MSCVLVYYDLFVSVSPYPSFYMPRRVGLQGRSELVIVIPDRDSISTCLFYKIYLLNCSGYELHDLDPLAGSTLDAPPFLFFESG
jgi:hypothetical protein